MFPGKVSAHRVVGVFGLLETQVESLVLAEGLTEKKPAFKVVGSHIKPTDIPLTTSGY